MFPHANRPPYPNNYNMQSPPPPQFGQGPYGQSPIQYAY
jgi:hypothetical protein